MGSAACPHVAASLRSAGWIGREALCFGRHETTEGADTDRAAEEPAQMAESRDDGRWYAFADRQQVVQSAWLIPRPSRPM